MKQEWGEQMNPFTRIANPQCARDYQRNANWATYERMRCDEELAMYDRQKIPAPRELISDAQTARWVEKELIREARNKRKNSD